MYIAVLLFLLTYQVDPIIHTSLQPGFDDAPNFSKIRSFKFGLCSILLDI